VLTIVPITSTSFTHLDFIRRGKPVPRLNVGLDPFAHEFGRVITLAISLAA
jgi:hypothetical protein